MYSLHPWNEERNPIKKFCLIVFLRLFMCRTSRRRGANVTKAFFPKEKKKFLSGDCKKDRTPWGSLKCHSSSIRSSSSSTWNNILLLKQDQYWICARLKNHVGWAIHHGIYDTNHCLMELNSWCRLMPRGSFSSGFSTSSHVELHSFIHQKTISETVFLPRLLPPEGSVLCCILQHEQWQNLETW